MWCSFNACLYGAWPCLELAFVNTFALDSKRRPKTESYLPFFKCFSKNICSHVKHFWEITERKGTQKYKVWKYILSSLDFYCYWQCGGALLLVPHFRLLDILHMLESFEKRSISLLSLCMWNLNSWDLSSRDNLVWIQNYLQVIIKKYLLAWQWPKEEQFGGEEWELQPHSWDNGGFYLGGKTSALGFLQVSWSWIRSVPNCPSSPCGHAVVGRWGPWPTPGWNQARCSWDCRKQRARKRGATGSLASAVCKGSSISRILDWFLRIVVHFV